MRTRSFPTLLKPRNLFQLVIVTLSTLVLVYGFASGIAQSTQQDNAAATNDDERKFENGLPKHVPLKVTLKNEESFKKKENRNWARELEIEVKNTGTKSIRYLYVIILMPDFLLEDGAPLGFQVKYGRNWLVDSSVPVDPNEPPIQPGESIVLKIPESKWKAFESIRNRQGKDDPKRIRLEMQLIDFGDGTALESIQGVTLTYPVNKSSFERPSARDGFLPDAH
jgi:hypothetical protein